MAYENVTPPVLPEYNTVTKYSYNGVELPKLPTEVDGKPCFIFYSSDGNYYLRWWPEDANIYVKSSGKITVATSYSGWKYGSCKVTDGAWVESGPYTNTGNVLEFNNVLNVIWTNRDIVYSADGTTYLAASDPMPVLAYHYHVLVFDYGAKESDWYQVHLYYSATEFAYDGSFVTNTGTVFWRVYGNDIETWTDAVELTMAPTLSPGLHDGVYQRIYTNHDILDGEGTVWLAADSVTPVEETGVTEEWLFSFKTGLSLGLCGNSLYIPVVPPAYVWDENTGQLIVNRDNGSLHFEFDQNTFNMTVIQQY